MQGFDRPVLNVGVAMLGLAFLVKAGMWPLGNWLVPAYSAAAGPVSAIFAVLSKVGIYALLRDAGQRRLFQDAVGRGDEALPASAVEELLRYDGPVEVATWRFATEPLTLGGQGIAAGDPVLVVLAAADRDPARFGAPDALRLDRRDNPHLGFGHGIHYCLGAPLARLEGQTALATLLTRLPDLRLAVAPEDLRWRGGLIMRGLRTLPVEFTPESGRPGGMGAADDASVT